MNERIIFVTATNEQGEILDRIEINLESGYNRLQIIPENTEEHGGAREFSRGELTIGR